MTERPILFSDPMVRALLSGQKTQTRRLVKPQPVLHKEHTERHYSSHWEWKGKSLAGDRDAFLAQCPYGQPGDRLWVREAWCASSAHDGLPPRDIPAGDAVEYLADGNTRILTGKYRPPMFMPRWACRLALEIVSVRVERLQDISEADARAEGVDDRMILNAVQQTPNPLPPSPYVGGFRWLWESINGAESWAANPWCWVVEFRRVQP